FSNIAFIGEPPDLTEGGQFTFEDEIRRNDFVVFDKKADGSLAARLADLTKLDELNQPIYRVGSDEGKIVFEQIDIEQLKSAVAVQNELDQLLAITFNNLSFF